MNQYLVKIIVSLIIYSIAGFILYRVRGKIDDSEVHKDIKVVTEPEKINNSTELKPLICSRCGGTINRRTKVCEYCGTEYK